MNQKPASKTRILTGTRPSGIPHLGNYFGAYSPVVELQSAATEVFFLIADYNALNGNDTPELIRDQSKTILAAMLATGLDPNQSHIYLQSQFPEVNELTWFLGCQTSYGLLLRAHSFKAAQDQGLDVNMGLFNYPVLMAADILLFDAHKVPVGQDQKQHLEMARDIAGKFNHRYGETFTLPTPIISERVATVPGLDGEKMSKSKKNFIPLFATDKEWKNAIQGIKTDSLGLDDKKDPYSCSVYKIYTLVEPSEAKHQSMAEKYKNGGYGYGHAKQELFQATTARFGEMRESFFSWQKRPNDMRDILDQTRKKLLPVVSEKINKVRETVGFWKI